MYVINLDSIPDNKKYQCGNIIAAYLMEKCQLPLLGHTKDGLFVFMKTNDLEKALKNMPFYLKINKIIK